MKRVSGRILAALLCALLLTVACSSAAPAAKVELTSAHAGEVVAINDDVLSAYLAMPVGESLTYLKENAYKKTDAAHDGQEIVLSWTGGEAPYTVRIADNEAMTGAEAWTTDKMRLPVGIFLPDTSYWWSVTDAKGNTSEIGTFRTGTGVRVITARKTLKADGVRNVRDLGGYKTADGKTVRYAMVYRGGLLLFPSGGSVYSKNIIDDFGLDALNRLHIQTELDLRNDTDCGGQSYSPLDGCSYVRHTFTGYTSIFPDAIWFDERTPESMHSIFSLLAKPESYPVYFHCLIGQDRTGTLAYLLLGLLGVEYEDILRDYELTAFSPVGNMNREASFNYSGEKTITQEKAFEALHERMLQYSENGVLSEAVANYLMTVCGVSADEIASIRAILLTDAQ